MQISVLGSPEHKKVVKNKRMSLIMMLLCGPKASEKSFGPILLKCL